MENYEFHYKKRWALVEVLRVLFTIYVIFANFIEYSYNENYSIFSPLNIAFVSVIVVLVIAYIVWIIVLKKNLSTKEYVGKIVYTYLYKTVFVVSYRVEYYDEELKEKKYIETIKIYKPLYLRVNKVEFIENGKNVGLTIHFKINKKNKKAYCLYIEEKEDYFSEPIID